MKMSEGAVVPVPEHWLRPLGAVGILIGLAMMVAGVLICQKALFPLYVRIWRQAPIVETVYPTFSAFAGLPLGLLMLLAATHTLLYRKPLTSQSPVWLKLAEQLLRIGLILLVLVGPTLAIGTTIALRAMDYRTCSKLRISGSGWQVFWVKNDGFCFRPDSYIEDNWPCKDMDGKTYCLRADGL